MTWRLLLWAGITAFLCLPEVHAAPAAKHLRAFESEAELRAWLLKVREESRQRMRRAAKESAEPMLAAEAPGPSVTNTQHAGVDEGGIVKLQGDYLIVLRRGRLFTIDVRDRSLRPVSAVDAFGPDIDPGGAWYDELLVSGDKVVVIGYSYARGGTEVGIFRLDARGGLHHRDTYHFRSYDYYSSRNYASRLIGSKLILYAPLPMEFRGEDPFEVLPAMRRWRGKDRRSAFRVITPPARVYRPPIEPRGYSTPVMHSVTTCDLAGPELDCEATGVIGEWGREFYVSPSAVYVWAAYGSGDTEVTSMLYRLPLDGSAPTALRAAGAPVDQFSFSEQADGTLNVLVRSEAYGSAMWAAESSSGAVALLRIPRFAFTDGTQAASRGLYQALPQPDEHGVFHNRFVGDYVLYGTGNEWAPASVSRSTLFAVNVPTGQITRLRLAHGVDRIEVMAGNALVVGASGRDLHFSAIGLDGLPARGAHYRLRNAAQGETRSHGFFFKPEQPGTGLLGLPVRRAESAGYRQLWENSAAIVFLRHDGSTFQELGRLSARAGKPADDQCRASCVDWYGNARPLFIRDRIIALLGYELVEGDSRSGWMEEVRRISFAPGISVAVAQ